MSENETSVEVLKVAMPLPNDAHESTIGGYLLRMLLELWRHGEGFSGKRPLGNSGWEWDVYRALVIADVVAGHLDDDGFLDGIDNAEIQKADKLITDALTALAVSFGGA